MKKIALTVLFLSVFVGYAQQDIAVEKQFNIEATILELGANYELPLSEKILADISVGYGGTLTNYEAITFDKALNKYSPYTRIGLKRYYNRDNRIAKGKEINNNRGNFVGIQNKIYYYELGSVMVNELHWGVQTELAKKLLFSFHIGFAHFYTLDGWYKGTDMFSPTLGLRLKYVLY